MSELLYLMRELFFTGIITYSVSLLVQESWEAFQRFSSSTCPTAHKCMVHVLPVNSAWKRNNIRLDPT